MQSPSWTMKSTTRTKGATMTVSQLHLAAQLTDPGFHSWTRWLGEELADDRVASVELHLGALARAGRQAQVKPASCAVLADPGQPDIARARAFSKVVSALTAVRAAVSVRPVAA
jgi:hypothetical protein